jgi:hypothetical protein
MPDIAIVDHVLQRAWRRDSHLHGEGHWHAVTATGLDLVAGEPGADPELHDAWRAARALERLVPRS